MTAGSHRAGGRAFAAAVRDLYEQGQTDYWLEPLVRVDGSGRPAGRIQDGDAVVFCCRRGEREIQLTEAFVDPILDCFPRRAFDNLRFVILTLYHAKFAHLPVAFAPTAIEDTLGEVVSRAGRRQLRIAESEKYAHVTFFFNGGRAQPLPGQDNVSVPSPHGLAFDQVPEMSLAEVTPQIVRGLQAGYDLVVANLANGDVLGHTQNVQAKVACAALLDARLGEIVPAACAADYATLMTADHGNLEVMIRPDGRHHVAHTANPVPLVLIDPRASSGKAEAALTPVVRDGTLTDVAPTVLSALGITPPAAMTGQTLAPDHDWGGRRRVLLLILDGWGLGQADDTNPIWLAPTPVWDALVQCYPCSRLQAAGESVGLRQGLAGNSEAGHMSLGAGRVVPQDDVRLEAAMCDGSFDRNEVLARSVTEVKRRGTSLHLIGLLSEASSHGSIEYPLALLRMAAARNLDRVYLHLIFDGRSTQPGSAPAMLEALEGRLVEIGVGEIATGVGRGIALDRDGDYGKTRRAYDALVFGAGRPCAVI